MEKEKEVWTCGWGVTLTDYAKAGLNTQHYKQKIRIKNNIRGSALRLQFSHKYGREAPLFQKVNLSINDGKKIPVTQKGEEAIRSDAFRISYSDEIKAEVAPGDTITIEAVLAEHTVVTDAALIPNTSLFQLESEGELICEEDEEYKKEFRAIPQEFHWLIGISGIEVGAKEAVPMLAFFGDSLIQIPYWISHLMDRAFQECPGKLTYKNGGISGNRLLSGTVELAKDIGSMNGAAGIQRMEQDIFAGQAPEWVVILEGINDIIWPFQYGKLRELPKSENIIDGLKQCAALCQQHNSKPILCTLLPFQGHCCWNGISEKIRQEVNQWIRRQGEIAYLDTDAYAADTENQRCLKAQWREADGLHLNSFGGKSLAEEILKSEVIKSILDLQGAY